MTERNPKLCLDCERPLEYKDGSHLPDDMIFCCEVCEWHYNLSEDKKKEIEN